MHPVPSLNLDEPVKSRKFGYLRRLRKKIRGQGAQILRNEAYLSYAAVTKDAAQRSIRTFYEAVNLEGEGIDNVIPIAKGA